MEAHAYHCDKHGRYIIGGILVYGDKGCPKCYVEANPQVEHKQKVPSSDALTENGKLQGRLSRLTAELAAEKENIERIQREGSAICLGWNETVVKLEALLAAEKSMHEDLLRDDAEIFGRLNDVEGLRVAIKHERFDTIEDPFIEYQAGRMSKGKLCEYITRAFIKFVKEGM